MVWGIKTIKIYADKECKTPLKTIKWDAKQVLKLITGKEKVLENTAEAGQLATATVYIRNEGVFPFFITSISYPPDKRVVITLTHGRLESYIPVKVSIHFQVPTEITPKDVIEAGKIIVKGHYWIHPEQV